MSLGRRSRVSSRASRRAPTWLVACAVVILGVAVASLLETRQAHAATAPTSTPRMQRDVAYGLHPSQRFDVYLPARVRANTPTIFYVHGGGWRRGDKDIGYMIDAKQQRWTAAGAVVISSNYRMLPDADPIEQARDIARAVATAQAHVRALGGDSDAFILMGHSAGAHLIGLLTASPAMARQFGLRPWLGSVLLDGGAIDTVGTMQRWHMPLFDDAFGSDPAYWHAASPLHQLHGRTVPLLAVCASGRRDSCPTNRAFIERARSFGTHAQLLEKPMSHREINSELGENNIYTREVEAFMRDIGARMSQ